MWTEIRQPGSFPSVRRISETKIRRNFGQNVRRLRRSAGMTQEELADATGMHYNYIGRLERGEHTVSLLTIHRLAQGLERDVTDLVR